MFEKRFDLTLTLRADNLLKTKKYHGHKTFDEYLKNTLHNSFAFRSSDEKEI